MPTMNVTQMCGSGSHEACTGWGTHHFNHPELDNGSTFTCACGHHYVPPSHGEVAVPEWARADEEETEEVPEAPETPVEPEEVPADVPDVVLGSD